MRHFLLAQAEIKQILMSFPAEKKRAKKLSGNFRKLRGMRRALANHFKRKLTLFYLIFFVCSLFSLPFSFPAHFDFIANFFPFPGCSTMIIFVNWVGRFLGVFHVHREEIPPLPKGAIRAIRAPL